MICRKLNLEWDPLRVQRVYGDVFAVWHGTNQDGKRVRVYIRKIESLEPGDNESSVINEIPEIKPHK